MIQQVPESLWQYLAIAAVTVLVGIIGWYARNTQAELKELRRDHRNLNDFVLREYHPKSEVNAAMEDIKKSIEQFSDRYERDMREIRGFLSTIASQHKGS